MTCARCSAEIDPWPGVIATFEIPTPWAALSLAGAKQLVMQTGLLPGERKEIDFTQHGVPPEAEILDLNLTSGGSALPLLLHGNQVIQDPFPLRVLVHWTRTVPDGQCDGPLLLGVTFFVRKTDDPVVRHLVDATRHLRAGRVDAVVAPANTAAEAAITPVIDEALGHFVARSASPKCSNQVQPTRIN